MSAKQTRTDQPERVSESELPRPPDASIVTNDFDFFQQRNPPPAVSKPSQDTSQSTDGGKPKGDAAAPGKGQESPNDQQSASGALQSDGDEGKPSRKSRGNYRYKKLQRAFSAEQNRNTRLEAELTDLRQTVTTLQEQMTSGTGQGQKKPDLKDFDSPEEFARAFASWEAAEAKKKSSPTKSQPQQRPSANPASSAGETRQATDEEIRDFTNRGKKQFGDEFLEALGTPMNVSQVMGEFMFDSDHGPALYVHLSNNPDEASQIFNSSPRRAERLLEALEKRAEKGDLDLPEDGELQFEEDQQDAQQIPTPGKGENANKDKNVDSGDGGKKPARRASKAPEPPENNNDGGGYSVDPNLETMDMDDYAQMRRKQEVAKKHRNVVVN